jgi:hypothetical protein
MTAGRYFDVEILVAGHAVVFLRGRLIVWHASGLHSLLVRFEDERLFL